MLPAITRRVVIVVSHLIRTIAAARVACNVVTGVGRKMRGRAGDVRKLHALIVLVAIAAAMTPVAAQAGGGPEHAVLIVDPTEPDSLYVANHYIAARDVPASNVLYMPPSAGSYQEFADFQLDALLGTLSERGLDQQIDYVIVAPGGPFYVPAKGLIDGGGCPAPVRRIAISSAYTLARIEDDILAGGLRYSETNRYFGKGFMADDSPLAFDARTAWLNGAPSSNASARRYFLGFMLGYSGERGNTVEEINAMIDRSVAVDGSRPEGTFYFMRTDDIRSTPRHPHFPATVQAIAQLGGKAVEMYKVNDKVAMVPAGKHDILGVMTGHANPNIDNSDMGILPGTFADHLTSFAATFDTKGQRKLSRWIANGASGSAGAVEEPCVFGTGITGKFPHPWLHVWYYQGMSLGEATFRSLQWAPFQTLFYGDPLTRPYAVFPEVSVAGVPTEIASGLVNLEPSATSETAIDVFRVMVDGRPVGEVQPGGAMPIDTTLLADGRHDLRVVAYESSDLRTQGRWLGLLDVDNAGLALALEVDRAAVALEDDVAFTFAATGDGIAEVRLVQNGRVIAAAPTSEGTIAVPARVLGQGQVEVMAVADHESGRSVFSAPVSIAVGPASVPGPPIEDQEAVAFDYTLFVRPGIDTLVSLPGFVTDAGVGDREIEEGPTLATLEKQGPAFLLRVPASARGEDSFTFRVVSDTLRSEPAHVAIRYCREPRIVSAPADQAVCRGRSARLTVTALGDDLAYQWFKDGLLLQGATESTLLIDNVKSDDLGAYEVSVRSHCGSPALEVKTAPAILSFEDDPAACREPIYMPSASTGSR